LRSKLVLDDEGGFLVPTAAERTCRRWVHRRDRPATRARRTRAPSPSRADRRPCRRKAVLSRRLQPARCCTPRLRTHPARYACLALDRAPRMRPLPRPLAPPPITGGLVPAT
jgi:hypothetical protein